MPCKNHVGFKNWPTITVKLKRNKTYSLLKKGTKKKTGTEIKKTNNSIMNFTPKVVQKI